MTPQQLRKEFNRFALKDQNIGSQTIHNYYRHIAPRAITPYIIEERQLNIAQMDVFSRLMMDRIIFLGEGLTDYFANIIIAQLLFLDSVDRNKDIQIYMNCPGGMVYSGLGIYDTMQYITSDIATICVGMAASMGAVLMAAGTQGKRAALKHARFMMHQPSGGIGGQATDIQIIAKEMEELKKALYQLLANHTKKDISVIKTDCDRDFWMNAEQAKEYGLVDEILKVPVKTKKQAK